MTSASGSLSRTLTRLAVGLLSPARATERVLLAHGGETIAIASQPGRRVELQPPRLVEPLPESIHGPESNP